MLEETEAAVQLAIQMEQVAYNIYKDMMVKTANPNLQTEFRMLALQELKHEALLKEFLVTGDFMRAKKKMAERQLDEDLEIASHLSPSVDLHGTLDGLQIALEQEHLAYTRYRGFMESSDSQEVKDLFYFLSEEEKKHEVLVRKEIAQVRAAMD